MDGYIISPGVLEALTFMTNMLVPILTLIIGYVFKEISVAKTTANSAIKELADYKHSVAEKYATQESTTVIENRIFQRFDRLENKIDNHMLAMSKMNKTGM